MSAAPKIAPKLTLSVPQDIADRVWHLSTVAGFSLLPLGGGEDGKGTRVREYDGIRFDARQVLGRMAGGTMYGIRLADMVVVDVDTDTDEARDYCRRRFGESTVQVSTSRGAHHYFEHDGSVRPGKIVHNGVEIGDIKTGPNAYVAGPGSIRPDTGLVYTGIVGELGLTALPVFEDRGDDGITATMADFDGKVAKGGRNAFMFRHLMRLSTGYDRYAEFEENALAARNVYLDQNDEPFGDDECKRLAQNVWNNYRIKDRIWTGDNSEFRFNRMWYNKLESVKGGQDAIALLAYLVKNHGHTTRERFVIVPDAIQKAGHLKCMSIRSLYNAIRLVVKEDILGVETYGGKVPNQYWFKG